MKYSYSRVETFKNCPYQYKLRYIDKLKTYDEYDPQDPLKVGTALHKGIETDVETAIKEYYNSYPIISDIHVNEAIKLEYWIPKVKALLPKGSNEVKIENNVFIGFIDYLSKNDDGSYDIYDFKYSNNIDKYMTSNQLNVYKYYSEILLNIKVKNLHFVFIPKVMIRQKKTESLFEFRKRLNSELKKVDVNVKKITYNPSGASDFIQSTKEIENCNNFIKKPSKLCDWCEYQEYCISNNNINIIKEDKEIMLPSTQRVDIAKNNFKKIWIYGAPFSGKTTLADQAPTPLNLNTDGNVKYVSMARLPIKDEVTVNGRLAKRKYAWEVLTEAIDDLEKGSDFETIVVDLLEDAYDYCRVYMCDKNGWEHESDDSFKAYDIVRSEFLRTLKRLLNLPYNIILISHEDTSRDIMKKGSDKITKIAPNIAEKLANKVAGMVDIVARVVVEDDKTRTLNFKSNEVIFGGGRLQGIKTDKCDLSWKSLNDIYNEVVIKKVRTEPTEHELKVKEFKEQHKEQETNATPQPVEETPAPVEEEPEQTPVRRTRTRNVETPEVEETPEQPVRRTRRVRGE